LWISLAVVLLLLAGAVGWIAWKRPAWLPEGLRRKLPAGTSAPAAALPAGEPAGAAV
jgi:type III secretion protein J